MSGIGQDMEKLKPLSTAGKNAKLVQPLWNTVWCFLNIIVFGYSSKIPKGIKSRDLGIYIPMLIASLFKIAKRWKQYICLSIDQWINKIWRLYMYMHMHVHTYVHTCIHIQWNIIKPNWNKPNTRQQIFNSNYIICLTVKFIKTENRIWLLGSGGYFGGIII